MSAANAAMNPAQKRIHQAAMRLLAERDVSQVSIRELALAAGVARRTIYNNQISTESMFDDVAGQMEAEMRQRVQKSLVTTDDPAQRLANAMRFFIRRAYEEPDWGRFFVRFAHSARSLRELLNGQAAQDLFTGLDQGRYQFHREQLQSVLAIISGSVHAAMILVVEGHKSWREAGADTAELVLRALGIEAAEARTIATQELPPLSAID